MMPERPLGEVVEVANLLHQRVGTVLDANRDPGGTDLFAMLHEERRAQR